MWGGTDNPHRDNPQPFCMCIDCRDWRRRKMGNELAASEAGQYGDRCIDDPQRQQHFREFNMARGLKLQGDGFIVLNAREHGSVEEFDDLDAATEEARIQAGGVLAGGHGSGMAIVYAPVAVIRPDVPAHVRVAPSRLMDQVMQTRVAIAVPQPTNENPVVNIPDEQHGE